MFPLIDSAVASHAGQELPTIGFAGVFWPSLWFPDASPAHAAQPTGEQIAQALAPSYAGDAGRTAAVNRLGELLGNGEAMTAAGTPEAAQHAALGEFHQLLGQLVTDRPHAVEDTGEWAAISAPDPLKAYTYLSRTLGTSGAGDAQGIGDIFATAWAGAKDALRVASFYEMKCRAGTVGRAGLGPLLERLHVVAPGVRVHLIGHSFGARLVSFALAGISSSAASPVASLTLVQGAFSHWSFALQQPFGSPGALNAVGDRVAGPLVATFSSHDYAVGRWYPKACMLSGEDNQSVDLLTQRWGAVGADGFHGASPAVPATILPGGSPYQLASGCFHSVDSQSVIADTTQSPFAGAHSDICHPEVAWLVVSAALTGLADPARGVDG
jgi:hypothetical protein